MFKSITKWWSYLGTKLGMELDASADAKVQLAQAIREAREQHRLLTEQAANVIANQKQLQFRLDRALEDYEKANASARQALTLADAQMKAGHPDKAAGYEQAAEAFADRIVGLDREIEDLRRSLLTASHQSEKAREAVSLNSAALQKTLTEREQLLSQLDQAKMQEQMNAATAQLNQTVGDDVPTFDEVRTKIERRLAAAQATGDLTGVSVDTRMIEVEQAERQAATEARLDELRGQLGLTGVDAAPTSVPEAGATTAATRRPPRSQAGSCRRASRGAAG
jgi:phage shock protein A